MKKKFKMVHKNLFKTQTKGGTKYVSKTVPRIHREGKTVTKKLQRT